MVNEISGYEITDLIANRYRIKIYRGKRQNQTFILKVLESEYPEQNELARFRRKFDITQSLRGEGALKAYRLEPYGYRLVMVLEDIQGQDLKTILNGQKIELDLFLDLAIKITQCIEKIHFQNIIHKDLNPSNILWNPQSGEVKLVDFSIATQVSRQRQQAETIESLEGTLAYISPEQTGRMNRAIDYRSYYYSLGITLYELLTGKTPFESEDPLEIMHGHLARISQPASDLETEIPQRVSDLT